MSKVYVKSVSGNAATVAGLSIPAEGAMFELTEAQALHFQYDKNFELLDKAPEPVKPKSLEVAKPAEAKAAEAKAK
jgi:hypothetical protein